MPSEIVQHRLNWCEQRIAELEAENKWMREFIQIILRANWKGYKDPVAEIQTLARRALEADE